MLINVSGLMRELVGSIRKYEIDDTIDLTDEDKNKKVKGEVRFIRTQRGILAQGDLTTEAELACSRCLRMFSCSVVVHFEEEYVPTIDMASGAPLPPPEDPEDFTIDGQHIIDLREAIRQYALLAIPMKPLCREDCAGLCQTCGQNLNDGACDCPIQDTDPRWEKLIRLMEK
jgi:uncharacterized protein